MIKLSYLTSNKERYLELDLTLASTNGHCYCGKQWPRSIKGETEILRGHEWLVFHCSLAMVKTNRLAFDAANIKAFLAYVVASGVENLSLTPESQTTSQSGVKRPQMDVKRQTIQNYWTPFRLHISRWKGSSKPKSYVTHVYMLFLIIIIWYVYYRSTK